MRYPWLNQKDLAIGECPNCRRASSFVCEDASNVWPQLGRHDLMRALSRGGGGPLGVPSGAFVRHNDLQCLYCGEAVVVSHIFAAIDDEKPGTRAPTESRIIVPHVAPRELPADAPAEARSTFSEASECRNVGALRGAAGLLRATVELIVLERGANGGDLKARINVLTQYRVDKDVVDGLHEARLLGNDSLHAGTTFTAEEVDDVFELVEHAVHAIYVEPAERERLRQARAAKRT